jgi:hypothetical protein
MPMNSGTPRQETFVDIHEVKDGAQILAVELRYASCGHVLETVSIDRNANIEDICQNRCHQCPPGVKTYSGFQLADSRQSTVAKLKQLSDLLTVNLKQPMTMETRSLIQGLMNPDPVYVVDPETGKQLEISDERRNVKLRFKIKQPD